MNTMPFRLIILNDQEEFKIFTNRFNYKKKNLKKYHSLSSKNGRTSRMCYYYRKIKSRI